MKSKSLPFRNVIKKIVLITHVFEARSIHKVTIKKGHELLGKFLHCTRQENVKYKNLLDKIVSIHWTANHCSISIVKTLKYSSYGQKKKIKIY